MHEMSIVEALLEAVEHEIHAYPEARVMTVQVRVGALRLIVPEVLQTCFQAATRDTPLAETRLEIEEIAATARCPQCRHLFPVAERWFECPQCGAIGGEILTGQELDLMNIELEEMCACTAR